MSTPEPVTALATRSIGRTIFSQGWHDLTFLHWPVDPARIARLLPAGVRPDEHDGAAWIGLVPFRMVRIGVLSAPGIPYFGSFCETNVRTYSVDAQGRRGVVFLSLDAARLAPVVVGRAAGLPYLWSRMRISHSPGGAITYTSRRRWPGPPRCPVPDRRPAGRAGHRRAARLVPHRTLGPCTPPPGGGPSTGRTSTSSGRCGRRPWWSSTTSCSPRPDSETWAGVEPASVLFSPGVEARFGPRLPT